MMLLILFSLIIVTVLGISDIQPYTVDRTSVKTYFVVHLTLTVPH